MYEKVDINKPFEYQATKFQLSYFPKEHNTAGIICTSTEVFNVYRISLIIHSMRKKCTYSELFWSAFFRIRTGYVFSPNAGKCGPE